MPVGADLLTDGSYITMSKRFAIDHAITSSVYHAEDYGVYKFYLKNNEFKSAQNPGEYLYTGPPKRVFLYGISVYDEFFANSTFRISKNKLRDLYSWLDSRGFVKESRQLAFLLKKESSGLL